MDADPAGREPGPPASEEQGGTAGGSESVARGFLSGVQGSGVCSKSTFHYRIP